MKIKPLDNSFFTLAVVSLLNINGAILMAVGIPQMGSPFLLLASLFLVWKLGTARLTLSATILMATLVAYLIFALAFSILYNDGSSIGRHPVAYGISILMLWAVMSYMQHALRTGKQTRVLLLIRNISVLAVSSVLASPILYSVFQSVPPSAESRFGGFFGNPNEAGVMACVAVAFILAEPFNSRGMQIIALAAASLAALLTFSKTAWIVLPFVYALFLAQRSSRSPLLLLSIFAAIPLLAFIDVVDLLEWLLDNPIFELNFAQERRIQQVMFVLNASAEASSALTNRDFLWQFGFEKIMQSPIIGSGLGTFHHLEGGLLEHEVWQGVHNTYLMVWGEAGLFVFSLFVLATLLVTRDVILHAWHPISLPLGLIIFLNLQVNHNVLTSRYFIVLIGVFVCLQARPGQTRSLQV